MNKQTTEDTTSTSRRIVELHEQNTPVAKIARELSIRYQFAYNVIKKYDDAKALAELQQKAAQEEKAKAEAAKPKRVRKSRAAKPE